MEEETRIFLIRIINTISIVLIWMIIQMTWGIYMGWAFFEAKADWHNFLYYAFFLGSLGWLIVHLKRKWKR
jgi:hypothetical protein